MNRAIEVAKKGIRSTYPNPMVGCVIVHNNEIIAEGHTSAFGGPHAEVNAINAVQNKALLQEASLYVTLEPCSHYGKTPPCSTLINSYKIPNIYIGCKDPNPLVSGKGIEILKANGANIEFGVLGDQCLKHHKRFICYQTKKRPYITLKWAQTSDGFIAPIQQRRDQDPKPYWISSALSRKLAHQWRSEEHAILIGASTLREDNPLLDVRHVHGINPIPVVLDPNFTINQNHKLYHNKELILITDQKNSIGKVPFQVEQIDFEKNSIKQILHLLYQHQILSVLVEGGSFTINKFIECDLWDEARVIQSTNQFEDGIKAPVLNSQPSYSFNSDTDKVIVYNNPTNV